MSSSSSSSFSFRWFPSLSLTALATVLILFRLRQRSHPRPVTQKEFAIDGDDVHEAARRIRGLAHITPILTCTTLNQMADLELFFKCELFQKIGAFKFRGAINAVKKVVEEGKYSKVVTHSSGNHAQALALAARMCNLEAHIVMPETAPAVKKQAVIGYGATIYSCAENQSARHATASRVMSQLGSSAILIPPYDYADVMAGQGTIALECLQQVNNLDAIIVPVGGGGMLAGICIAAHSINPSLRIYAAEPINAGDCAESMRENRIIPAYTTKTIADGLRTSLGELTYPIIRSHITRVLLVSESDIITSQRLVWERMKLLIEPSAAVGVAAALQLHATLETEGIPRQHHPKRVAVVLCGGNQDLDAIPWVVSKTSSKTATATATTTSTSSTIDRPPSPVKLSSR